MSRSKVEEQRREIHAFKEGNWPDDHGQLTRSLGRFSRVVESVSIAWLCGFKSAANRLEFRFEKSFKIGHDLRAIDHDRPWSSVDRGPDSSKLPLDDRGINSTRKDPRSRLDRAAIADRSERDRGVLPRVAYAVGLESDARDSRKERETPVFTVAVGSRSIGKSSPAVHLDENRMMIVANDPERLSRDAFSAVWWESHVLSLVEDRTLWALPRGEKNVVDRLT